MRFKEWLSEGKLASEMPTFKCADCENNLHKDKEYAYMLKDSIWKYAGNPPAMLCVGCLEKRLKRKLRKNDFNWDMPLTNSKKHDRSDRLKDRMQIT